MILDLVKVINCVELGKTAKVFFGGLFYFGSFEVLGAFQLYYIVFDKEYVFWIITLNLNKRVHEAAPLYPNPSIQTKVNFFLCMDSMFY